MSFENNHKERKHTYGFLLLLMLMFMLSFPLLLRSIEIYKINLWSMNLWIKPIWISLKGYILFSQLSFSSGASLRRFKWRHCHKVGKNEYLQVSVLRVPQTKNFFLKCDFLFHSNCLDGNKTPNRQPWTTERGFHSQNSAVQSYCFWKRWRTDIWQAKEHIFIRKQK